MPSPALAVLAGKLAAGPASVDGAPVAPPRSRGGPVGVRIARHRPHAVGQSIPTSRRSDQRPVSAELSLDVAAALPGPAARCAPRPSRSCSTPGGLTLAWQHSDPALATVTVRHLRPAAAELHFRTVVDHLGLSLVLVRVEARNTGDKLCVSATLTGRPASGA